MKEVNYILLFDKDFSTSSVLTLSIHKEQLGSSIYQASSTHQALKLLDKVCEGEPAVGCRKEVCFIVDLNMDSLEGYVFLISLEQHDFSCPVRVYVLNDQSRPEVNHPSTKQYHVAGKFDKPLNLEAINQALNAPSPEYFQKKAGTMQLLRFY